MSSLVALTRCWILSYSTFACVHLKCTAAGPVSSLMTEEGHFLLFLLFRLSGEREPTSFACCLSSNCLNANDLEVLTALVVVVPPPFPCMALWRLLPLGF